MKDVLSECDLKAVKQKQMRKDLENLKLDNSSSYSSESDQQNKKSKISVLDKGKKVSIVYSIRFHLNI